MTYAIIENNSVSVYPASRGDVQSRNPQTSFPKRLSDTDLTYFGVYPVNATNRPSYNADTQILTEDTPVSVNGQWTQVWMIQNLPSNKVAENNENEAKLARNTRDMYLAETDWVVTQALEAGQTVPADWVTYRQALRDVPAQGGFPASITWPTKPS
jgi:hypothetical protein